MDEILLYGHGFLKIIYWFLFCIEKEELLTYNEGIKRITMSSIYNMSNSSSLHWYLTVQSKW